MTFIMEFALYFFIGFLIAEAAPDMKGLRFWALLVLAAILIALNAYAIKL